MTIIFVCKTCEYRNSMKLGLPNFIPYNTEMDSLTEAWEHLKSTNKNYDDVAHEIVAEIRNE